jgi:hypothetical protein
VLPNPVISSSDCSMVSPRTLKVRLLALFVTVFVCMNGAGAACVAYCQTMGPKADEAQHCPLKRLSKHCDPKENLHRLSVGSGRMNCCPMTVSFFPAPIDKYSFSIEKPSAVLLQKFYLPEFRLKVGSPSTKSTNYRGPPPLDRRVERIKQQLLLI